MKTKTKKRNTKDPILKVSPSGCLPKKRQATDSTMRNVRAANKKFAAFEIRIERLENVLRVFLAFQPDKRFKKGLI